MRSHDTRHRAVFALFATLLLAGCESSVTVDLTVESPQDVNIQEVAASLRGLEFEKSGGGTETFEFTTPELVELFDYLDGNTLRLISDEELSSGTYTGVRLLFDEEDPDETFVLRADENDENQVDDFPLTIADDAEFAPLSFTVDDEDNDESSFTLTLDLRQSLREETDTEYSMAPVLRTVDTDEAATVQGTVQDDCTNEEDFLEEAAVYVFENSGVTPDDLDGDSVEPYATATVFLDTNTNEYFYTLQFLPPGDYTIALACRADLEDPTTSDELEFVSTEDFDVEESESLTVDVGS